MTTPSPSALSAFSSLGGMDLGLEAAGYRLVGAIELAATWKAIIQPIPAPALALSRAMSSAASSLCAVVRVHTPHFGSLTAG